MERRNSFDATFGELNRMELEKPKMGIDGTAGRSTQIGHEASGIDTGSAVMTPKALLVCFSGKIGSGKTSTSMAVAKALGCGYTSFSGYLRDVVAEHGDDPDCRASLQEFGQRRIEEDAELFCRDVLVSGGFGPGEHFVLDGIRHVDVLPHLVRIAAPSEVRLIFLDAAAGLRSIRIRQRSIREWEDFERAASHVVEGDMEYGLPRAAHAIVDGSLPERYVVRHCLRLIDGWRWARTCVASAVGETAGRRRRK